jgi:hypothetical protein
MTRLEILREKVEEAYKHHAAETDEWTE